MIYVQWQGRVSFQQQWAAAGCLPQLPADLPATNVISVRLLRTTGENLALSYQDAAGETLTMPLDDAALCQRLAPYAEQEVLLGVRPEHLRVGEQARAAAAKPHFTINAKLKAVEFIGAEQYIYFELAGKVIVAKCPASVQVRQGQTMDFTGLLADVFFFAPQTEQRIA